MTGKNKSITREQLCDLLQYSPETGLFVWLVDHPKNKRLLAGRPAGFYDSKGYVCIKMQGRLYKAHRLAWLYMTGKWPRLHLDHKDMNPANNRWENLREADYTQNKWNTRSRGVSGLKGVCWDKQMICWKASIREDGYKRHLGYFKEKEAAYAVYTAEAHRVQGEFARV